jgi:hypothetical protein
MKLCKNCRHYDANAAWKNGVKSTCTSPKNVRRQASVNPVTGEPTPARYHASAATMRSYGVIMARLDGMCGKSGRWFQQKV